MLNLSIKKSCRSRQSIAICKSRFALDHLMQQQGCILRTGNGLPDFAGQAAHGGALPELTPVKEMMMDTFMNHKPTPKN
ncbi:MAG: hypothetical protein LC637_02760, partial [Xanthomonadaceae bacterium]|nr:hypothetical protein [Xanthomonadaceae bacterium]